MGKHLLASVLATLSIWLPLRGFAQSRNADIPPCSLFTASDAQRIVGVHMKMVPPLAGAEAAKFSCSYEPAEPTAGQKIRVEIVLSHQKSPDQEDEFWNMKKSVLTSEKQVDTKSLAGVGDDAFAVHATIPGGGGGLSTSLFVRKGTSDFEMQSNGTKSEPLPAMKEIAKKIADRL